MMQGEMNFDEPIEEEAQDTDAPHCTKCGVELNEHNWQPCRRKKNKRHCRKCDNATGYSIRKKYHKENSRPDKVWDPEYTKVCPNCKKEMKAEFFSRDNSCKDGYHSWCIECGRVRKQKPRFKYTDLRRGARLRNYEWSLEEQDTSGLFLSDCYYCGKPSVEGLKIHGLDRIDNNKGYHLDNVVPCCEQCNRAKLSDTKEDFIEMCKRVADRHSTYEKSNMESIKVYLENKDLGEFMKENFDYPVW